MKKLLLSIALVTACGTDSVTQVKTLPDLQVPPAPDPAEGWQIITPITEHIAAGSDLEMCEWTNVFADKQTDIKSVVGVQNEPPGHHIVAYYTTVTQPPGTSRVCQDSDMATFRLLAGEGGEGIANAAPGNMVFRVPEGAQIVLNTHYLNTTDHELSGQSVSNLYFADPNAPNIPSGNVAFLDDTLDVPVGDYTMDIHCVQQATMKLWYFIPHMHAWGKHIDVDVTQAGVKTNIFNVDWDPSLTFHPPEKRMSPDAPMMLNAGDSIDVHCEWNNDSGHDLPFGFEMCVAFGEFIDDTGMGNLACDRSSWTPF